MQKRFARLALISTICVLVFASGCLYDATTGQVVVTEQICVLFRQHQETGTFATTEICDKFKTRLEGLLAENGASPEDVVSLGVVGGTYKVVDSKFDHDWVITSSVTVTRQDDPQGPIMDGPALFVGETTQSLTAAQKNKLTANLDAAGIQLIDDALADVLAGGDPRVLVTMEGASISPVPSTEDPLDFKWLACIRFQAVIQVD